MYKFNAIFCSFGTKKHNVKWGTSHGKKTYRPWEYHWLYRDYFSLFNMRSRIMGKIVPLIFMDFSRAGGFFAKKWFFSQNWVPRSKYEYEQAEPREFIKSLFNLQRHINCLSYTWSKLIFFFQLQFGLWPERS